MNNTNASTTLFPKDVNNLLSYSDVLVGLKQGKIYTRKAWMIAGSEPRLFWYIPTKKQIELLARCGYDYPPAPRLKNKIGVSLYWFNESHDILENDWLEIYE